MPYKDKENQHKWYERNKTKVKNKWKAWQEEHRKYCNKYSREYHKKLRQICLDHYGHRCICCGETTDEFLCFDHIEGGGTRQRKGGNHLYRLLIKNNFPSNIRILCHNCNSSIGFYGYCPHHPRKTRIK